MKIVDGMMFLLWNTVSFMPDIMWHTPSRKSNNKDAFGKWEMSLFVILGKQWLCLETLLWMPFLLSLFLIVNHEHLPQLRQVRRAVLRRCSWYFYELLDERSLCSWSNFVKPTTPREVYHCCKFTPFVDTSSHHGSLRNGFVTLSSLIHANYFICSWIYLDGGMMFCF